ncbi:hypothetical protein, partial [Escherichia coli]|uniref:hypothetical protein n=1 Tax=Escherichia coli TaxID=562 RepID=UPI003D78A87F
MRLQQAAGRDRTVHIKPLAPQGLPMSVLPTQPAPETLNHRPARALPLNALKHQHHAIACAQSKTPHSLHAYRSLTSHIGLLTRVNHPPPHTPQHPPPNT